jgi:hypothetical protein
MATTPVYRLVYLCSLAVGYAVVAITVFGATIFASLT